MGGKVNLNNSVDLKHTHPMYKSSCPIKWYVYGEFICALLDMGT